MDHWTSFILWLEEILFLVVALVILEMMHQIHNTETVTNGNQVLEFLKKRHSC